MALWPFLIPMPASVQAVGCGGANARVPLSVSAKFDPGAREEIDERWRALGIGTLASTSAPAIVVRRDATLPPEGYRLSVSSAGATIESSDEAGAFYAATTLAQLPARDISGAWSLPCVRIEDRPALRWRVLSDDVSRGPLPTMAYFEKRIRTIAAFKMNGYSPYMEHVFVSPTDPLPAPLDGITPQQLRELAIYAKRFHVTLIPEQQTFAHMHGTLSVEKYADLAELPHGFLFSPNRPESTQYLSRILEQELAALPAAPPFFHIGSDETATLGLGQTQEYVARAGRTQAFAEHVNAMNAVVARAGARTMLWDDAIEQDASIMPLLPKGTAIINWHYGAEPTFAPYIEKVARGGFEQMVAPGASNWNEIFPNVAQAMANERTFVNEGKAANVLGLFQTVWHDDGETLYETTWYPVLYAAALAWEKGDVDPERFASAFPRAFFGVDDARYAGDVAALGTILTQLEAAPYDRTNALFWADPFDEAAQARMAKVDLKAVRKRAESVQEHLLNAHPPLHADAAFAMWLAARRYDALARKFQIGVEVRAMYADAVAHLNDSGGTALRDLYWARYWMWELRDAYEGLAPLYERAWKNESRGGHLASNLERYHLAAQQAIARADAIYNATYDGYVRNKTLPPFNVILSGARAASAVEGP